MSLTACPNGDAGGPQQARSFGAKSTGTATSGACFKCGEEGHFSNGMYETSVVRGARVHLEGCSLYRWRRPSEEAIFERRRRWRRGWFRGCLLQVRSTRPL